jgi:hypothetical protein
MAQFADSGISFSFLIVIEQIANSAENIRAVRVVNRDPPGHR